LFPAGYVTVPVPAMPLTENAEPATACSWSSVSFHVTVTVVPFAATTAELMVGAVVSTTSERVAP
jgi:hypothetical protein